MVIFSLNRQQLFALVFAVTCVNLANCQATCNWITTANTNSPGGVAQSSANDLLTCQNMCAAYSTTTCKNGFDWDPNNTNGNKCWFSTTTTLASSQSVTHYNWTCIIEANGCYYNISMNGNSPGGSLQTGVNNFTTCFLLCDNNPTCGNMDWVISSSQCWINNNTNNQVNYNSPGVVDYNYICPNGASTGVTGVTEVTGSSGCTWTQTANTNSPGGTNQPSATSLTQCQAACLASSNKCQFGLDWNSGVVAGQQCWVSSSAALNINGYQGVTHWACSSASPTPTAGPTQTVIITGSVGPTVSPGPGWTPKSNAISTMIAPGLTTVALLLLNFLLN